MSNLWDYNQEAPIHYLIARHWDALKIEAVCRSLLAAVPKQQLENFLVADSLQREKVQAYFAAFKDQPLEYLHAQFHLFYQSGNGNLYPVLPAFRGLFSLLP